MKKLADIHSILTDAKIVMQEGVNPYDKATCRYIDYLILRSQQIVRRDAKRWVRKQRKLPRLSYADIKKLRVVQDRCLADVVKEQKRLVKTFRMNAELYGVLLVLQKEFEQSLEQRRSQRASQ